MKRKPLLLALAACVGGVAVLLWPLVARPLQSWSGQGDDPRFVSPEEAQRQVSYPLWIPRRLPLGAQMMGAVVGKIKAPDLPEEIARARAERHYHTGYGLGLVDQNGMASVLGMPGSPAERAGIGGAPLALLALNGHPMRGKTFLQAGGVLRLVLFGSPFEGKGLVAAMDATHRAWPLLKVTYRAPDGHPRTVLLRRERYLTQPSVPHVYRGNLAILDFRIRGRSLGLYEMPVGEGEPPHGYHQRWVKAGDLAVLLADSEQGPLAFWRRGPTRFEFDDLGGVLSQAEELDFIRSMYRPQYQARR